jgi:hypothetical protein
MVVNKSLMKRKCLFDYLRSLDPSGPDGFEGLIAQLMEALTGRRFSLARSGYQAGRDMSTSPCRTNRIAVECKRFLSNTNFNERELLGELVQVSRDIPDLDLWVIVTTKNLEDRIQSSVCTAARDKGFEVLIIDSEMAEDNAPSSMEILCGNARDTVSSFIKRQNSKVDMGELEQILNSIATHPSSQNRINELRNGLSSPLIGFENLRHNQNQWLLTRFRDARESRAAFGQVLNVADVRVSLIDRIKAWKSIDEWYVSWETNHSFLAILGEEGDGKTWAIATYLYKKLKANENFPLVLFITSTNIPSTSDPQELLAQLIARQSGKSDESYWKRRVQGWAQRVEQTCPLILLILDGINERQNIDWRALMEKLDVSPWKDLTAVIITCRTPVWGKKYSCLSHLPFQSWTIPPFDNSELHSALTVHGLKPSDIDPNLLPLIRKPRYLDLMVRLREVMSESGDVTVERLLYEDWRDRISNKSGLRFSHQEFHTLIRDLAEKSLRQSKSFSEREIEDLVPTDSRMIVQELISTGILNPDPVKAGKYTVERKRLVQGFGLFLKEQVSHAISSNQPVEESIARLLEPHSDMDIKVEICGAAAFHAIVDHNFPEAGRLTLFQQWLKGRNFDDSLDETIIAYFPLCPQTYLDLAEIVWSDASENPLAQEILMRGLLKWYLNEKLQSVMITAFEHWMGFIHPCGFTFQRGSKGEKSEEIRRKIEDRLGYELTSPTICLAGYDLTVAEDDGLLRLARVVLAVISHSRKKEKFVRALVIWSLSRALMGHPNEYDLVSWALKTPGDDIWKAFLIQIEPLIRNNSRVTQQAAYLLLSCEGSSAAYRLRDNLPKDLFPPNPLQEMYRSDPCSQYLFTWHRKDYATCLQREDLNPFHIASSMKELSLEPGLPVPRGLKSRIESIADTFQPDSLWRTMGVTAEDHKFEEIEAALCAYAPEAIAGLVKRVMRDMRKRDGLPLRQLSLKVKQNLILLGSEEMNAIEDAWNNLLSKAGNWDEAQRIAEEFLFPAVIANLPADEQLKKLLTRPNDAFDLLQYEPLFKPLEPNHIKDLLLNLVGLTDKTRIKRILWFFSTHFSLIPPACIENVKHLLECDDTILRSLVLEMIYKSPDLTVKSFVTRGKWAWGSNNGPEENYWGSLLIGKFGADLSYQEVRARVHPCYLGYAVKMRGYQAEEVSRYAEDIHTVWKNVSENAPSVPENFPLATVDCECLGEVTSPGLIGVSSSAYSRTLSFISRDFFWGGRSRVGDEDLKEALDGNLGEKMERLIQILRETVREQGEAGNHWFYESFSKSCLKDVVTLRPDLLEIWMRAIESETPSAERILNLSQSFYEAVLDILLETDPCNAVKLVSLLDSSRGGMRFIDFETGILCRFFSIFRCNQHPDIQKLWDARLEQCSRDSDLFEIAFIAQDTNNLDWLKVKIRQGLDSSSLFKQARAFTLIGFLDCESMPEDFESILSKSTSWVRSVAEEAYHSWNRNVWAKGWFQSFLKEREIAKAWASFNLFQKCVDRRFWLWRETTLAALGADNDRLTFLNFNVEGIKKSIEANEEKRNNTFLSEKVLDNQAWPWMRY